MPKLASEIKCFDLMMDRFALDDNSPREPKIPASYWDNSGTNPTVLGTTNCQSTCHGSQAAKEEISCPLFSFLVSMLWNGLCPRRAIHGSSRIDN
ncbi:MAG: hypothetical protein ACK4RK_06865 [Gemmataceae bacterium]